MIGGRAPLAPACAALVSLALGVAGCADPGPRRPAVVPIDAPASPGSMAPHLAPAGREVLMTWIEPGPEGHRVRFSSLDRELAWSEPATVAQGDDFFVNWADFPSVRRTASGALIAHWLRKSGPGTYAYDVLLARSDDAGATWAPLGALHDDATETEHGFVSLVPEETGLRAFWLDGREMEQEGGPMTLRTAVIGDGIDGDTLLDDRTCECCQTDAAMTAEGPVVVYRDRSESEIRDIAIVRRAGEAWLPPRIVHADGWEVPGCPVNGPAIAAGGTNGRLVALAWFTAARNSPRVLLSFSRDAGASFEEPLVIDEKNPVGRVDVTMDSMGHAIVSWLAGVDRESAAVRLARVSPERRREFAAVRKIVDPLTLASTGSSRASGFPRIALRGEDVVVAWTDTSGGTDVRTVLVPVEEVPALSPPPAAGGPGRDAGLRRAPDYAALDLDGNRVTLAEMRGRWVLLNFWATWCSPCREEAPVLARLHERHAEQGLTVIGVSLDDASSHEAVRAFIRRYDIPYVNLHDPEDLASRMFRIPVLPMSLLIDPEGRIVWRRDGLIRPEDPDLERALEVLSP